MKALILAAGFATRLYPLTKEHPKPLLPVHGRPIIDYIVDKLEEVKEIDEIIIVSNSKFISQFKKWLKEFKHKKKIVLVDNLTKELSKRRGAVGDMNFAIGKKSIRDDLLVIGGDNLFRGGLKDFLSFAQCSDECPAVGIYDIKDKREAKKYGVIKIDGKNRIIDFKEKPRFPGSTFIAMCLYYFPQKSLRLLKEYLSKNKAGSDATGLYIDWLRKKVSVYGFLFKGQWFDIGDYKFYNKAKLKFVVRRA